VPVCERISGRTIVNARRAVSAPARKPGCQRVVAFHTALYRLSGNRAIEDTVAAQWPHLKRSMGAMLNGPEQRPLVWASTERSFASCSRSPAGVAVCSQQT